MVFCIHIPRMANNLWRRLPHKLFFTQANYGYVRTLKSDNCHRIVSSDDGNVIVCWHPEVEFPYENSLPVNLAKKETNEIFKVKNVNDIMSIYDERKEEFVREKLMRLTYTTKHRWFPEGIHKRRKKRNFDQSREYL